MSSKFSDRKKIVFICLYLAKGGAERVLSILINYFSNNYDVTVVLLRDIEMDYPIRKSIKIIRCNWNERTTIADRIKTIMKLRGITRESIIISFLYSAIRCSVFVSLFNSSVLIASERNDPHKDPPGICRRIIRNISYHFVDSIVFQTNEQRDYFPSSIRKRGIVIPNPVISGLPYRNNVDKIIISVCRYDRQKNIKMSIDAFEIFSKTFENYEFHIYGKGDLEVELQSYIKSRKLEGKVFLKGFVKNIHEKMEHATMYVSSSDYEGISNSMLEALAIGLPCICTDCPIGGTSQVIDDKYNGILIKCGDIEALASEMIKVVQDEKYAEFLSKNAILVREQFSETAICNEWESLINNLKSKL